MAKRKSAPTGADTKDAAFRDRLAMLVKEHSLRGLARKLDIPFQNLSNYLKKSQPPLSFGRKLVEELGVNPAWVLTGEGSPMLSDVAEATSATAADLMDLVKAMNDVTRMRLGALSGKQQAQALRELNDAMLRYEELRGKLNAYSRPVMQKIVDDLAALLDAPVGVTEQLHSLVKAGEQMGRFCEDSRLQFAYKRQRSRYLQRLARFDEASALSREVVAYELLSGRRPGVEDAADIQQLVWSLLNRYHLREAQQIAEAGLIFAESGDTRSPSYRQLLETAAIADFTRGNLVRGRERMLHVAPLVDDIRRRGFTMPILAIMHFYAGAMTYREVFTHFDDQDTPFLLSPLVFWSEKPDDLDHYERALERCVNPASIRNMLLISVTSLLAAQRGSGAMKQFDDRFPRPSDHDTHATFRAMNYPVIRCQIALAAGQHAQAVKAVIETEVMLEKAKPRVELPIGFAAIHHRNVLRASKGSRDKYLATARIRALDFFKRHIDAGYAVFRSALM